MNIYVSQRPLTDEELQERERLREMERADQLVVSGQFLTVLIVSLVVSGVLWYAAGLAWEKLGGQ